MKRPKKTREDKVHLDKIIGRNIRAEREARGISRDELAELLDLTTSHMGLIERGERGATAVTLSKLTRVFDVPIDHFFQDQLKHTFSFHGFNDEELSVNRKKILSMVTKLNEHELGLIVHTIRGILDMNSFIATDS